MSYDPNAPQSPPPPPPAPVTPIETPRRDRKPLLLALVIAAVIVIGGGIGIAVAASDDGSSGALPGAPQSTTAGSPASDGPQSDGKGKHAKKGKKGQKKATRGTITAVNGSTWTIKTKQGSTVQVTITSDTKLGTKKAPATASSFTVGKTVAVVPKAGETGDSITAASVRIADGHGGKGGAPTTPAPSSSPS